MISKLKRKKMQRCMYLFQLSKKWWDNDLINAETHVNQLYRITKLNSLISISKL